MKKIIILISLLMATPLSHAGEFYLRTSFLLNPGQFEVADNDPIISNPLGTMGYRWFISEMNNEHQNLHFFIEHSSGISGGEYFAGINQIGIELVFD